ncbi:MAG: UDP-N-acetylmuramate dehydrogenase [Synergistes sp.]|nr:UDP-N-acetylmuramate dehydrogenase [Synergistes sp.]
MSEASFVAGCGLGALNTWGCGGSCRWLASPKDASEAAIFIKKAADEGTGLYILGGGSNILVQDGFIDAGVISTGAMDEFEVYAAEGGARIEAAAGVPVKKLLALSLEKGLTGMEFLTGIPGTFGGALFGNAGAAGCSFAPLVEWAETISFDGSHRRWRAEELLWKYRTCPWGENSLLITKASLRLRSGSREEITENIRRFSALKKGQPIGAKTAGCVFKNPEGNSAGRLLDVCGCKKLSVGAARVSQNHANFIENSGGASAADIYALTEMCRKRVYEEYGIVLEYEIKFFGAF